MFIVSFYLFTLLYTVLFSLLFGVDFSNLSNPWLYVLVIAAFLISYILSIITQIFIIYIVGLFRKKKGIKDKTNHAFANSLLSLGLHLMRIKVIVSGEENIPSPDKTFVLVGNHQENWDIIILKPIFRKHILNFIAKEALVKVPVFGMWIQLLGNIFISRTADRSAAESIIKGIRNYKQGTSMGIFPEGKRSFGNEMIDFKPGAFKLAMKPKADILIATQYNTCTIFKKFPWKRYRVHVHIHPLVTYSEYQDMKSQELSAFVKEKIQTQLDAFQTQVK